MFIAFADQLELGGVLSARIGVGRTPDATTACPFWGRSGTAQQADGRGWPCAGCGRLFSMRREVVEHNGQLYIVDDAA